MKEIKLEKIIAFQTNDKTLFKINKPYLMFDSNILANDKPLVESFHRNLYVVDGELNSVILYYKDVKSKRYELKNKELYNEKIPMIIDEHSKEKYLNLIENDLYEVKYEYETKQIEYEIETIMIDDTIPFLLKSDIEKSEKYSYNKEKPFYISLMQYSIIDDAIVPFPIKNLTCPVMISKEDAFLLLVDSFSKLPQKGYKITRAEGSWLDVNENNLKNSKRILHLLQFSDYRVFYENIYGKNYKDLVEAIQKLAKDIREAIINKEYDKPLELIELFRQERYYPKVEAK